MAANSPAERRVLVTRPAGRADDLLAVLRAEGVYCCHQPLLEINALAEGDAALLASRQHIADLDHYHTLIFISVNAVEYGLREIDRLWPQWPARVNVLAIGAVTARALRDSPLAVVAGMEMLGGAERGAMNTEALLAHPQLQDLTHQRLLIFRGVGGREALADKLRQRGAVVDYAECYRRSEVVLAEGELDGLLASQQINTVCLNSGETVLAFSRLISHSDYLTKLELIVPSERVANLARQQGFRHIITAENAGTAATLAALRTELRADKNEQ